MSQRKTGLRYPSGGLRPTADTTISPALLKRCMETVELRGAEQRLSSAAGRMMLMKQLSPRLACAAMRVAEVVGRYDWLTGRRRSAASPSYEIGRGGDDGRDIDEVTAAKIKDEYEALVGAPARADKGGVIYPARDGAVPDDPRDCRDIIIGFCVEDQFVPWYWREHLVRVLELIATHFEHTDRAGRRLAKTGRRHLADIQAPAPASAQATERPKIRAWRAPEVPADEISLVADQCSTMPVGADQAGEVIEQISGAAPVESTDKMESA